MKGQNKTFPSKLVKLSDILCNSCEKNINIIISIISPAILGQETGREKRSRPSCPG